MGFIRHSSFVIRHSYGLTVLAALAAPASASTSVWTTNADRFAASTHVVEGDVRAIRYGFVVDSGEEWPVTLYEVDVDTVYRGASLERFTLAVLGGPGRDPDLRMEVPGAPRLEVGDHALLAIAPYLDVGYLPVGLGAGVVRRVTESGALVAGSSEVRYVSHGSWTCNGAEPPVHISDLDEAQPLAPPLRWEDFTRAVTDCARTVAAAERVGGAH